MGDGDGAFDHLALSCTTLEAGAAQVEARLGVSLDPGGRHAAFGTHNRLLSLGPDEYLEVIAVDPEAPPPGRARWFGLDRFEGPPRPTGWVVRVADLAPDRTVLPQAEVLSLSRGGYRWRMAVPRDGVLPHGNLHPAAIVWDGPHPARALTDHGIRLRELVLRCPEPRSLAGLVGCTDPRIRRDAGPHGLSARLSTPRGDVWL